MAKNLVIVESPAKAKTIEGFLGKDFIVKSSYGHVRDLPKDDFAIDIKNNFKPTYIITKDKKDVVAELKKLAKKADLVWLATDDDREGEAISWHLKEALELDDRQTKRIVFREITKKAILNAIDASRGIDHDLVNAQQARRLLDRLVGFELSPVLWKKIKRGLSAGRVQSVAVRLIVEREREIDQFNPTSSFKVSALFQLDQDKILVAELKNKLPDIDEAKRFLESCKSASFTIKNLEKKPSKKSPAAPFTTSTLQQEASRKLGFSVSQTMTLAQKLYEAGKITYMRTDSTNLSEEALSKASREILKTFGKDYLQLRQYKTKSQTAQEAHEAIRPTDFNVYSAGSDSGQKRLYELIWKRAIASQMADAQIEKTTATIDISTHELDFIASGEVIQFEGFLKVYLESKDEDDEDDHGKMLPPLKKGQILRLSHINALERFTKHAPRYTEASLVKQLEEMGIGRPSTYAPTISTIQKRGYIIKESREGKERICQMLTLKKGLIQSETKTEIAGTEKNKLFPTDIARVVNDFLIAYFSKVIDYSFTAEVEKEFDLIAQGKKEWVNMLSVFYEDFHPTIEKSEQIDRKELNLSRELGKHPKTGEVVIAKIGKFGPYVQLGDKEDEKPQYASLLKDQHIETITLEEALELFKLPREIGSFEGEILTAAIGRYGPYIKHNNKFYSLVDLEPLTVTEEEAIQIIKDKRKEDAQKVIKLFEDNDEVQVLNGRYGPYIKVGKKNVKIPKDKKPEELSLEECLELAEKAPERKRKK